MFAGFSNTNISRSELRRLFRWLKTKGVTAETGDGKLTRQGIEEYVADCVILLDHRVEDQSSRQVEWRIADLPFVQGDPVLLTQVLVNLLSNALKPVNFEQFRKMVKQLGLYWLLINQLPSSSALRAGKAHTAGQH